MYSSSTFCIFFLCAYYMRMVRMVTRCTEQGDAIGHVELVAAHTNGGTLHRAFSVFVFTSDRAKLLLQRRIASKPTFGGLWANTCCSHPFPQEPMVDAGKRRLREEMGLSLQLTEGPSFVYRAEDPRGNGFVEHEYDTILLGTADQSITIKSDPSEVMEWKWMSVSDLEKDMKKQPELYAPWLGIGLQKILDDVSV